MKNKLQKLINDGIKVDDTILKGNEAIKYISTHAQISESLVKHIAKSNDSTLLDEGFVPEMRFQLAYATGTTPDYWLELLFEETKLVGLRPKTNSKSFERYKNIEMRATPEVAHKFIENNPDFEIYEVNE